MVFLCCSRPSPQQDCLRMSGSFNYDSKFSRATAKPLESLKEDGELVKNGFSLNHARVLVQNLMKRAGMLFGHGDMFGSIGRSWIPIPQFTVG
ncbi:unnamed protein product [Linum trigynum]|uniref:Uncharacterized protein n=1 Tax=Linum trigynum TaxID=586398 RepID=A0AAV2EWN3_9ROSI